MGAAEPWSGSCRPWARASSVTIAPDAQGHFVATGATVGGAGAPTTLTITGTIAGSALSGTIAPLGVTFGATADPVTGPTSTLSGLYQSSNEGSTAGSTYSIVGTQGEVFVLAVSPTAVASGSGSVDASTGSFSVTTGQATTVAGSLNATANTVSGTVTTATGTVESFGRHSQAAIRATSWSTWPPWASPPRAIR